MEFSLAGARHRAWNLALACLAILATVVCAWMVGWALASLTSNPVLLSAVPLALGSLAVTALAVRAVPGLTWDGIGLARGGLPGLGWGFVAAVCACGLLVLATLASGLGEYVPFDPEGVRFDWRDWWLGGTALLVAGAFGEEFFTRGLALQLLARALTPAGAVVATSVGFGLLHGANPGVTVLAQCNTVLFGAVFGLAVAWRRSLWLAIGLHLGWNLCMAALGVNLSGITMRLTALSLSLGSPAWLTGGEYGFEGGLMASFGIVTLAAAVGFVPGGSVQARPFWQGGIDGRQGLAGVSGRNGPAGGSPAGGEAGEADVGPARRADP